MRDSVRSAMSNISIDDAVLVEQCRVGDSFAMERLVLKYQNRIYNVILKICTNPDDAAELTQDTFVKVIEAINEFRGQSSFYTWLFRIAVNLTLNYCQRGTKFGLKSLDAQEYGPDGSEQALKEFLSDDGSLDPAAVAQNKELTEIAIKSLSKLDDSQRAVIVLRDVEGMNYAQIASVLGTELGTVKSRLSRARGNLRKILESTLK
jgi:RNA polymerase sigma-70 factor (ECF subfamily)